jgi:hypothetical protein
LVDELGDRRGSPERLRSVGIEGPKMSVSRIPALRPRRAKASARFTELVSTVMNSKGVYRYIPAIVDFPTPPFAEDTATTFFTSLTRLLSGRPLCMRGMLPVRGRP